VIVDRDFVISAIDRRVFGSFVEHMGRCVYGGLFEPGDPSANEDGFRLDVLELVKELGVSIVRYPGGNFLSGYDWKDGVGPADQRPARLDLAWHALETNQFGVDEFMRWCTLAGIQPMMATNLGTGTLKDALELQEYCNVSAASKFAEYRAANGFPEPHGVKVWCLGNEMDGPWQIGHMTAGEYGRRAAEVARAMRLMEPGLELVACGSSSRQMPTFAAWEDTVLEETYDLVDYISAHTYYECVDDLQSFLASSSDLDAFLNEVCAVADSVKARLRSAKTMYISLDEYNVWYQSKLPEQLGRATWEKASALSEDDYTVADAVVLGNLLISILRRSDRVKMACLAQLVNTIATIRAEPGKPAWRQTSFYPFSLTARYARGESLATRVVSPPVHTTKYGTVSQLDAIATVDDVAGEAAFFLVNRSVDEPVEACLDLRGFGPFEVVEHIVLSDPDPLRSNNSADTTAVAPFSASGWKSNGSTIEVNLPAASWNLVRIRLSA
jgi:alpha-L-arabinofuranosidase